MILRAQRLRQHHINNPEQDLVYLSVVLMEQILFLSDNILLVCLHQIDILLHQIMVVLANLHKRQMPAAARLMVIGDWKILTQQEINNRARQSWV